MKRLRLNRMIGPPAVQIDAGADTALVQVGPAIGCLRRQAQHRHCWLVAVYDHADVGDALVGDGRERRMQKNTLLHHRLVRPAAQRIHAGENIRNVLAKLIEPEPFAVVANEVVAVLRFRMTMTPRPWPSRDSV